MWNAPCANDVALYGVFGRGLADVTPSIDLLIRESSKKIEQAAKRTDEKIFVFVGGAVSFNIVAMYHNNKIFSPTMEQMIQMFGDLTNTSGLVASIFCSTSMTRANHAKLDHFTRVGKVLDLEVLPAQRKIVREASERLKNQLKV